MKALFAILTLTLSTQTIAGYYLEPFLGYQFSAQQTEISNDKSILIADETRFETSGLAAGLRAGSFFFPTITFGLDLKYASTTGKGQGKTSTQTDIKRKLSELTIFATATYFDGPLKYWVGAGIYGDYSDSESYNKEGKQSLKSGQSYKAGIGFYFTPTTTINLDLELIKTKTVKDTSTTNYPLTDGTVTNALISVGLKL